MSATTTNTVIATVDAVPTVPTVPNTLITTAAILIAAKGRDTQNKLKIKWKKQKILLLEILLTVTHLSRNCILIL